VARADDVPYSHEEMVDAAREIDAIVCLLTDRVDGAVIDAGAGRLRVIGNVAVGFDNVDLDAARRAGVAVCNTPGVLDETTADLAFALILAASRLLSEAERDLRAARWRGWGVGQYLGVDVHRATLGIVGYGRIGRAVARRAAGFEMRVIHHARVDTGEPGYVAGLDALLAEADVVTLHVPLTDATRHLIDDRRLRLMKPTAVLVNTARGPVVDEEALAAALEGRIIFAAGLDVYEREPQVHPRLLEAPRTVLLPHIGSASVATRTRMAQVAAEGVRAVLAGERPPNLVT
jgi:glyoxylate reductase